MVNYTCVVFFLLTSFQTFIIVTIFLSCMFKGKVQFLRYEPGADIRYGDFKGGRNMFVSGGHLFCNPRSFALSDGVGAIEENSLLRALHLPNGTLITEELRAFARCLASAKLFSGINKVDYCFCFGGMAYGSLFFWSCFNLFVGGCCFLHALFGFIDGGCLVNVENSTSDNVCQLIWALFKFLTWLCLTSYASYRHLTWMDDVILASSDVESLKSRSVVRYFRRPWIWDGVIFLAWIYSLACLTEILLILFVSSDETHRKHECDKSSPSSGRRRSLWSNSPPSSLFLKSSYHRNDIDDIWDDDGSWNVVSYPSSVKEREKCTIMRDQSPSISSFP